MTTPPTQAADPIVAMLPEIRGRRVLKPCVLYARLGHGGMGAVYLAKHLTLMQRQVVKCLWLMGSGNPGDGAFVDRFQQEARIAAQMTHQNLVRVTHVDRLGDLHYLVMEYVEGEDLERRVRRAGPMNERSALTAMLGAARGLGYAHQRGIVHRDVKPANLMVSTHGEVKVIDLGLARAIDTTRGPGHTVGAIGTPLYMAPEQWHDSNVTPAADVWALGAVAYFLLTGESLLPSTTHDVAALRDLASSQKFVDASVGELGVSRAARRLLRRCLAPSAADRFVDANELVAQLQALDVGGDADLVDAGFQPRSVDDEPDDEELRTLQRVLARHDDDPQGGALAHTLPQGHAAPGLPDAHGAATHPATGTPRTRRHVPTSVRPAARRRAARGVGVVAALLTVALVGAVAAVGWPTTDYQQVQEQAMAAIYQERFADADRLLQELERSPAFADQARRLRIDALVKSAQRVGDDAPLRALQHLATASALADRLMIARDGDAARAQVAAARQPLVDDVTARMAAALEVTSPLPGSVVTGRRQLVTATFDPGPLGLVVELGGRAMTRDGDAWRGHWQVPDRNGEVPLTVVVRQPDTDLRHVVTVPVDVRRGAVALHVEQPPRPVRGAFAELSAAVDNGPVDVTAHLHEPSGARRELALGERDGAFTFRVPLEEADDGRLRVQLVGRLAGEHLESPVCTIVLDRRAPTLRLEPEPERTNARTLLLRGAVDEACRVFVDGDEAMAVRATPTDGFEVPCALPADDGPVAIELSARDEAGNVAAAAVTVRVVVDRRAPTLAAESLTLPARVAAEQVWLRGTLDEPGVVRNVDGDEVETDAEGRFELLLPLPSGEIEQPATLRVQPRDLAGNVGEERRVTTFVDRRGPTVLPGAADGRWWSKGFWVLRVEDRSLPCTVTLDGATEQVGEDGLVRVSRRQAAGPLLVEARDALGNTSTRTLSGPSADGIAAGPAPGPSWGTPTPGAEVDPQLHLYERVDVAIGEHVVTLRLVRPLREAELPRDRRERDPRAVALLQGQPPFYLAETELPVAVWAAGLVTTEGADDSPGFCFDPVSCRWAPSADASWRRPLHPALLADADDATRARWPVVQVTPQQAQAFCRANGLRLPTAAEWRFVARMGTRNHYGWLPAGPLHERANLADLQLAEVAPALAAFDTVDDGFATLAPTDALPGAGQRHPWGFRHLLGNAAEWCTTDGGRFVACGGSWLSEPSELRVDAAEVGRRTITTGAWDCVGLRVARDL